MSGNVHQQSQHERRLGGRPTLFSLPSSGRALSHYTKRDGRLLVSMSSAGPRPAPSSSRNAPRLRPRPRGGALVARCHECRRRLLNAAGGGAGDRRPAGLRFSPQLIAKHAKPNNNSPEDEDVPRQNEGTDAKDNGDGGGQSERSPLVSASLGLVTFYRKVISPLTPPSCRFIPTCSTYALESFERYGFAKGFTLTAWRIFRCNPWGGSGYDPPTWPPPPLR